VPLIRCVEALVWLEAVSSAIGVEEIGAKPSIKDEIPWKEKGQIHHCLTQ
jgi:hypothetical protein